MIAVLILIPIVGFALFFFACYKTDWEAIDEQNRQYYMEKNQGWQGTLPVF